MSIAEKLKTIADNEQRVYDAGKNAEREAFWDVYQTNGTRSNYNYAFYGGYWKDIIFNPCYDIVPASLNSAFRSCGVTDLAGKLTECGVELDTSECSALGFTFYQSYITHLPTISTVSASTLDNTFNSMGSLESIDKLILKGDGSQTFSNPFVGCSNFQNIIIEGVIGQDGFNVSACTKLSKDSLMSIINALMDGVSGKTVTLGSTNKNKLTADELKIATDKGWQVK